MHATKVRSVRHWPSRLAGRLAGVPVATGIGHMRFAGAPHDALIVKGQPVYPTFANRNK